MTQESQHRLIVVLGQPESDTEAVARAAHASGAGLAADAATDGDRFAVSGVLEGAAAEINDLVGIPSDVTGPPIVGNRAAAVSRRKLDDQFDLHLARARTAVALAFPGGGRTSVLRFGQRTRLSIRFWLAALEATGARVAPVLLHRNPVATAFLARASAGRPLRQSIFLWHHHALEVLSAAPTGVSVVSNPMVDPALIGFPGSTADRWRLPSHPKDEVDLASSHLVSDQTRDLARLLRDWAALDHPVRTDRLADLRARFDEAVALTGAARPVTLKQTASVPPPEPVRAPSRAPTPLAFPPRNPLLVHFHIFKNAGTSVDAMLKANFGEAWLEREFTETTHPLRQESFRKVLEEHSELKAFSSHTASLPAPAVAGRAIIPIVFVRHPLLRIASAYAFERKQDAQTRGAILAKSTDLRGYVTALLDDPKLRHARNFQTARFALGTPGKPAHERQRALETLARLPFVGLVEAYDESIQRLGEIVQRVMPEFRVISTHTNATAPADDKTIDQRLAALRLQLSPEHYDRLCAENVTDLELFDRVRATCSTVR